MKFGKGKRRKIAEGGMRAARKRIRSRAPEDLRAVWLSVCFGVSEWWCGGLRPYPGEGELRYGHRGCGSY